MKLILSTDSLMQPSGGIGRYTFNLLLALVNSDNINKIHCYNGKYFLDSGEALDYGQSNDRKSTHASQVGSFFLTQWLKKNFFLKKIYGGVLKLYFYIQSSAYRVSVYHETNYVLRPYGGCSVLTLHDLSHVKYPEYHPSERVDFLNKHLGQSLRRAAHIITVSEYIRAEVIEHFSIDPSLITAVHLGVDSSFRPRRAAETIDVLAKYNLQYDGFLLSVATMEPRKNIEGVIDAYLLLDEHIRQKYPLILFGISGWNNSRLKLKINDLVADGQIRWMGFVDDCDLPIIMSSSRGVVFIPFYEGFGLPALEAIASGVPLLTSNVASLPEVVGDAALYCDPYSLVSISQGMKKILDNDEVRERLVIEGPKRAKGFTWEKCALETVKVYEKAMENHR